MSRIRHAVFLMRWALLPVQTHILAEAARKGLRDNDKPRKSGFCEMFARLCREDAYGPRFNFAWLGSARKAGLALKKAGFSIPLSSKVQAGDLAYNVDDEGDFGHVRIAVKTRLSGILWAENSTTHADDADARGLRTTAECRKPDLLIRLPNKRY